MEPSLEFCLPQLISAKTHFNTKKVSLEGKKTFYSDKGSIHQEDITTVKTHLAKGPQKSDTKTDRSEGKIVSDILLSTINRTTREENQQG